MARINWSALTRAQIVFEIFNLFAIGIWYIGSYNSMKIMSKSETKLSSFQMKNENEISLKF